MYFQYFDCSIIKIATFLLRYIFLKSINIGPLILHCFRITNQLSIIFLKTSIYIQIVIRWASIHRLSICIIDLPTTAKESVKSPKPVQKSKSSVLLRQAPGLRIRKRGSVAGPGIKIRAKVARIRVPSPYPAKDGRIRTPVFSLSLTFL